MDLSQALSWIGFITGMFIGIPQIVKTIRARSARDVSTATFVLIVVTSGCLLARSVAIREAAFVCYYSFIIVTASVQLVLMWKFRKA